MNINFPLILVILVALSGIIVLLDKCFLAKQRATTAKLPLWIDYAHSFFPILLIVLLLRSFLVEPFRIPSGSLEPTLLVGDFVLVNKYIYGLRLPVLNDKILKWREPKHGDVVVFRWPPNPKIDYIKRIIGVPGDHIQYKDKILYINGKKAPQKFLAYTTDSDDAGHNWVVEKREENFLGVKHDIYIRPDAPAQDFSVTVPKNDYFVMGDNRDDSSDSRFWGFVPEKNLIGKAFAIWMSWSGFKDDIRWRRIGRLIH